MSPVPPGHARCPTPSKSSEAPQTATARFRRPSDRAAFQPLQRQRAARSRPAAPAGRRGRPWRPVDVRALPFGAFQWPTAVRGAPSASGRSCRHLLGPACAPSTRRRRRSNPTAASDAPAPVQPKTDRARPPRPRSIAARRLDVRDRYCWRAPANLCLASRGTCRHRGPACVHLQDRASVLVAQAVRGAWQPFSAGFLGALPAHPPPPAAPCAPFGATTPRARWGSCLDARPTAPSHTSSTRR